MVKQGVFSQRTDLIHGYYWYKTEEIALYFRHVIYGTAFPELRLQRRGSTAELKISGNNNPLQVRFVSTKDCTDDSHSWRFESEDIDPVGKNRYKKQIPVSVKAFLFEVEERDNLCRLSTKIVLTDKKGGER